MKKFISIIGASAVCAVCMAGSAFAAVDALALNDGVYNIDVESDSKMFKVINCDIVVKDGVMTAEVMLSGTGYGKLFAGTGEQAAAADEAYHIPFAESAEGKYVYILPISALDEPTAVAAWSTKNSEWYDRTLTFKSDKLPPDAYKAAIVPIDSEPDSGAASADDLASDGNTDDHDNPNSGVMGMIGVTIAAAAVAVVSARKKN